MGFGATRRGTGLATLAVCFGVALARVWAFAEVFAARFGVAFFVVEILVAFLARALPAGERLVAGLRRVDLATPFRPAADFAEERAVERDESLFSGLPILKGKTV
jgi:hypothetical protein